MLTPVVKFARWRPGFDHAALVSPCRCTEAHDYTTRTEEGGLDWKLVINRQCAQHSDRPKLGRYQIPLEVMADPSSAPGRVCRVGGFPSLRGEFLVLESRKQLSDTICAPSRTNVPHV